MRQANFHISAISLILAAILFAAPPEKAEAQHGGMVYRPPVRDPSHTFQRRVWSWKELKQRNVVMQRRDFSCGAAALATVVKYYWDDDVTEENFLKALDGLLTLEEVRDRVENGLALTDLKKAADKAGYDASIGRLSFTELAEAKVPLVVGITVKGYDHFVVFRGTDGCYAYLADPIRGNIREPVGIFQCQWQENAVLVVAKRGGKVRDWSPLSVRQSEVCVGWTNREVARNHAATRPLQLP